MNWHHLPTATPDQPFPRGLYKSDFKPVWWLKNAHAQTIFSVYFRKPEKMQIARTREKVTLPDGDWIALDWHLPEGWLESDKPLVLGVHGLSGSGESHYIKGLQIALSQKGWGSVAMTCRGAGGEPNHLPRAYHAGASDDVMDVLNIISAKYPTKKIAVVGYSLGGNMTLKLMRELGNDARVLTGVAVSVPLMLDVCCTCMDNGFSKVYRKHMMTALLQDWKTKAEHFQAQGREAEANTLWQLFGAGKFESFWDFDHHLVAPLHGFSGAKDYYARCSSRQFLKDIRIPTLVIHSSDDPFMSPEIIPSADELSDMVSFELADKGGHVGFIEGGGPFNPQYYLERRVPQWLEYIYQKAL